MGFSRQRKIILLFLLVIILFYTSIIFFQFYANVIFETREQALGDQRIFNISVNALKESQLERLQRIQNVCQRFNVPGLVTGLYVFRPRNITYCRTHKAVSTYWVQMFRFLHKDFPTPVKRPSQISKFDTHLSPMKKTERVENFNEKDHYSVLKSYKFMMVRDPYHRLWSVYIDKFILLDIVFWKNISHKIVKMDENHPSFPCPNITFTDMVRYIVNEGERKPEDLDSHFRPMHYGCNPCIYKPDFVGKVETIMKEKDLILKRLAMEKFNDVYDFQSHVINEIHMISEFEYTLFHKDHPYKKCLSQKQMEERTLRTFIINGYLSEDTQQNLSRQLPLGESKLKSVVSDIFLSSSRTPQDVEAQRNRFRINTYNTLPRDLLQRVRKLYTYDFALHGYNPTPTDLFDVTTKQTVFKQLVSDIT